MKEEEMRINQNTGTLDEFCFYCAGISSSIIHTGDLPTEDPVMLGILEGVIDGDTRVDTT